MKHYNYAHQYQEHRRGPASEEGPAGDCWRTAIACLLEIPRDHVPNFADLYPQEDLTWWDETRKFIWEYSNKHLDLVCCKPEFPLYRDAPLYHPRVIGVVRSSNGEWNHSILLDSQTGEFEWDPYEGAEEPDLSTLVEVYGLVVYV